MTTLTRKLTVEFIGTFFLMFTVGMATTTAGTLVRDVMDDTDRDHLVSNIVGHASQDVSDDVQRRVIGYWTSVDAGTGARVAAGLGHGNGTGEFTSSESEARR